jgi:hypothetical protein
MLKNTLAIIVGYAIFALSAVALFAFGQDPHSDAALGFKVLTAVYGAAFSCLGGYVGQLIAKRKTLTLNFCLALIIAGFAAFSWFKSGGQHWTQLFAIVIFAPSAILGGYLNLKRREK